MTSIQVFRNRKPHLSFCPSSWLFPSPQLPEPTFLHQPIPSRQWPFPGPFGTAESTKVGQLPAVAALDKGLQLQDGVYAPGELLWVNTPAKTDTAEEEGA